ncbi:MAG: hypothetical protein ACFFAE_14935 [Candidatus Hodarchaeota archaeon]
MAPIEDITYKLLSNEEVARLNHLPISTQMIHSLPYMEGILKPQEIKNLIPKSERTIRYTLKTLIETELVYRIPDFYDMRTHFFTLKEDPVL